MLCKLSASRFPRARLGGASRFDLNGGGSEGLAEEEGVEEG